MDIWQRIDLLLKGFEDSLKQMMIICDCQCLCCPPPHQIHADIKSTFEDSLKQMMIICDCQCLCVFTKKNVIMDYKGHMHQAIRTREWGFDTYFSLQKPI
jgi:hypothetical protein